ncbi:MAG: flagellar biosynthesis protein FlhF [Succinatimonas sp.]|nr:flagellar biosynthesis protein FlhF [Succinatimonas sp.]
MKLKRFCAKDMRSALALIKVELGPDAVIMSSKRIKEGVEIVAGLQDDSAVSKIKQEKKSSDLLKKIIDNDKSLSNYLSESLDDDEVKIGQSAQSLKGKKKDPEDQEQTDANKESFARSLLEILNRQQQQQKNSQVKNAAGVDSSERQLQEKNSPTAPATSLRSEQQDVKKMTRKVPPAPLSQQQGIKELLSDLSERQRQKEKAEIKHGISSYAQRPQEGSKETAGGMEKMQQELESLRKLLQYELAGLIKDSQVREQPVRAMLSEALIDSGFDRKLANKLVAKVSSDASVNFAWRELEENLVSSLKVGNDEIVSEGGVVTLIGPAGVGKTTTAAKLAARFVLNYGPKSVALVTCDHYRIGAAEQIKTYGRIMGCATYAVKSVASLRMLLPELSDKSLVIVDTAGVGLSDERFEKQLSELKSQRDLCLKHYLVLPATAQRRVLEEACTHFASLKPNGLILTKTDESSCLCDALSMCISADLKLCYMTCGQRVPEDLKLPSAGEFVRQALFGLQNETARSALGDQ